MSTASNSTSPSLIVVMGVSGCGKSTLAEALAKNLGAIYLDADDFHSDEAKALMSRGTPLTDAMREPWVDRMRDYLDACFARGESAVLAFSGLRAAHRARLRRVRYQPLFLFLDTDAEHISARHAARSDHFFNPALIESQFDTLERPDGEPDVVRLDANAPFSTVLASGAAAINESRRAAH